MKMKETPPLRGKDKVARKLRAKEKKHLREHNALEAAKAKYRRTR